MTVIQNDLFGNEIVTGTVEDRITWILENYPATRNNYKRLIARYWLTFDGLGDFLGLDALGTAFVQWASARATSPKTIQNRCMEIQNRRPDLEAQPEVEEWRQNQSRAGVVK